MAVRVARARAHHRHTGLHLFHECVSRRGAAAVVRDLQQVQAIALTRDAGRQEQRIDLFLDIAGEDHPPRTEANIENDRDVVDRGA